MTLVSAVTSDADTERLKGRTVMAEQERYDAIKHCRYVDEVIEGCPWLITPEFMEDHQVRKRLTQTEREREKLSNLNTTIFCAIR